MLLVFFYLYYCILNIGNTIGCLLLYFLYSFFHVTFASDYVSWILHLSLNSLFYELLFSLFAQQQTFVDIVIHLISENFKLFLICIIIADWYDTRGGWFCGSGLSEFILIVWDHRFSRAIICELFLSVLWMRKGTILCISGAWIEIVPRVLSFELIYFKGYTLQLVPCLRDWPVHWYLLYCLTDTL